MYVSAAAGISSAWLSPDVPESIAFSTFYRTWNAMRAQPAWREWLATHLEPRQVSTVLNVEERPKRRLEVRGGSLSCYLPGQEVRDAHREHRLQELAVEVFEAIYLKWADKLDLPAPPVGQPVEVPSRLP